RQMWVYALPGLSNVWMLLIKATSLLSLLQIADIVLWADRLGAPNFLPAVGLVHDDWRWRYYLVLFLFYILVTWLSEKAFDAIMRRAGRGILSEARSCFRLFSTTTPSWRRRFCSIFTLPPPRSPSASCWRSFWHWARPRPIR